MLSSILLRNGLPAAASRARRADGAKIYFCLRASSISSQEGMTSAPRKVMISVAMAPPNSFEILVVPRNMDRRLGGRRPAFPPAHRRVDLEPFDGIDEFFLVDGAGLTEPLGDELGGSISVKCGKPGGLP